nr:hypothetical protein [Neisseriaceae bacterium]
HWHPGQHVIGLIGAGMLHNGRGRFSNHWVVLTEPPKPYAPSPDAQALIRPKLFSWGQVQSQGKSGLTFKRFKQHFYGAWVYGQIP